MLLLQNQAKIQIGMSLCVSVAPLAHTFMTVLASVKVLVYLKDETERNIFMEYF